MLGNDSSSNFILLIPRCKINVQLILLYQLNKNAIAPTFNNAIADVYYDHTQQSKFYQME
jgi:hypothetical protein